MKREINQYLLLEFGLDESDADIDRASDEWPFTLTDCGTVKETDGSMTHLFRFTHEGSDYFAIYGSSINFFPSDGLDTATVILQIRGSKWIGARSPIDLNTSKGDHPVVPRIPDRKARFDELARQIDAHRPYTICEGLFLEKTREHLGLIVFQDDHTAAIVGDRITMRNIPFPQVSPWRRLSIGIGRLLEQGKLGQQAVAGYRRQSAPPA